MKYLLTLIPLLLFTHCEYVPPPPEPTIDMYVFEELGKIPGSNHADTLRVIELTNFLTNFKEVSWYGEGYSPSVNLSFIQDQFNRGVDKYKEIADLKPPLDTFSKLYYSELNKALKLKTTWSRHHIVHLINDKDEGLNGVFADDGYSDNEFLLLKSEMFANPNLNQKAYAISISPLISQGRYTELRLEYSENLPPYVVEIDSITWSDHWPPK